MRRCFLINDRKACPVAAAGGGLEIFRVSGPLLSGTQQRGAAVKGMSGREITSVERVARQLCRAFLAGQPVLTTDALRDELHRSSKRQGRRKLRSGDFEQAVALLLSNGWLSQEPGGLRITDEGLAIARKSRAIRHRVRFF